MKRLALCLLLAIAGIGGARAASFDCKKAATRVEKLVCADASLSQFDEQLFFRTDLPENSELIATSVPVELDPGDVLFFHAKTLHAASRNHSTQTKYSVVFTFRGAENLPIAGTRSAELPELMLPT